MGVVSRRWMWVESMGVARGCGCKEVSSYYLSLLILYIAVLFCISIPTFCSFKKKNFFPSCSSTFL